MLSCLATGLMEKMTIFVRDEFYEDLEPVNRIIHRTL